MAGDGVLSLDGGSVDTHTALDGSSVESTKGFQRFGILRNFCAAVRTDLG